jgi:DNA-binding transcriptional ArsR family regulator
VSEQALNLEVDGWLEIVRISQLSEWDVLVFLRRHGTSLASAAHIALLLGYDRSVVGKALDSLEGLGLAERSRSSRGVRFYRFAAPADPACRQSIEHLMKLSEKRSGRLVVAGSLSKRERSVQSARAGLHLA